MDIFRSADYARDTLAKEAKNRSSDNEAIESEEAINLVIDDIENTVQNFFDEWAKAISGISSELAYEILDECSVEINFASPTGFSQPFVIWHDIDYGDLL